MVALGPRHSHDTDGYFQIIFVYNTALDSDGGAWRKRCGHTSWYNEGAGQYRGARKEFPSIAVITVTSTKITIYDGDDPNLSMWMIFEISSSWGMTANMIRGQGAHNVYMLNGILVDAKTLKPYTYGINYIKTYGMGFLDNKPVKDISDADLKVIEEAEAYKKLINLKNIKNEEIAKKKGKSASHISNLIRICPFFT